MILKHTVHVSPGGAQKGVQFEKDPLDFKAWQEVGGVSEGEVQNRCWVVGAPIGWVPRSDPHPVPLPRVPRRGGSSGVPPVLAAT